MSDVRDLIPWKERDSGGNGASRTASSGFSALRALLGEALLAAGANATTDALAARLRPAAGEGWRGADALSGPTLWREDVTLRRVADWSGVGLGSVAGALQIAQALEPSPYRRGAAAVLSALVAGAGAVAFLESVQQTWGGRRPPSLPHLVLTSLGFIGLVLDRAEARAARETRDASAARRRTAPRRQERIVIRI